MRVSSCAARAGEIDSASVADAPIILTPVKRCKALCLALFRTSALAVQLERKFLSYQQWRQRWVALSFIRFVGIAQSVPRDSAARLRAPPLWNNFPVRWIDASREVSLKGRASRSEWAKKGARTRETLAPDCISVGHRGSEQPPFWMDRFSLYIGGYNVTEAWRGTKSSSAYRRGLASGCVRVPMIVGETTFFFSSIKIDKFYRSL